MGNNKKTSLVEGLEMMRGVNKKPSDVFLNKCLSVSIDIVFPNEQQPRESFEQSQLQELADSIKSRGILNPITVRIFNKDKYKIIAGERRWRAAKLAGLNKIPILVRDVSDEEAAELALIENLQREDLNPIEEANGYQRLIDEFQLTHDDIAKRVGRSRTTITNVLRLLNLEGEIRKLLQNGKLEMGHARALLSLAAKEQIEVAHIVVNKQLSVRETERLVQKIKNPTLILQPPSKELVNWADNLSNQLSKRLSSEVKIHVNYKGEGRVTINFLSPDEIDWLANALK